MYSFVYTDVLMFSYTYSLTTPSFSYPPLLSPLVSFSFFLIPYTPPPSLFQDPHSSLFHHVPPPFPFHISLIASSPSSKNKLTTCRLLPLDNHNYSSFRSTGNSSVFFSYLKVIFSFLALFLFYNVFLEL